MDMYLDENTIALDRSVPPQRVEIALSVYDGQCLGAFEMGEHLLLVVRRTQDSLVRIRREPDEIRLRCLC